jgi:hypothetical protein
MSKTPFAVGIAAQSLVATAPGHRPTIIRKVRRLMYQNKRACLAAARAGSVASFATASNFSRVARAL